MICQWRETDKSRHFAITEFNNCFIIRSPSLFWYFNHFLVAQESDLHFSLQSVAPITHEQSIICSKTRLNDTTHEQTIICRQLFAGHVVGSRPMEGKKTMRRMIINNYWMSWAWYHELLIKTEVCVICRSRRLRQITQTRGFDNSWHHAKTEFNNCFIICSRYCIYHVKFTSYCELIECSRPIRFFIVSLMYNN